MVVTLQILLDCINDYDVEIYTGSDWNFERIVLLTNDCEMASNKLFVCNLSEFLEFHIAKSDACFICLRDQQYDVEEKKEEVSNFVIVNNKITLSQLFSKLQDTFYKVIEWQIEMMQSMANGCKLQDILAMSKPIIGNYIAVNDAAFRLIGNTKNIECDDLMALRLAENGFHPESNMEIFRRTNRFAFWEKTDYYIETGRLFSTYTLVGRIFRINGTYTAHAVMHCNNYAATPCKLDLFNILCCYIAKFAAKHWENRNTKILVYNTLIINLIEDKVENIKEIEARLHKDFPDDCSFCMFRIPIGSIANTLVGKISQELSEWFPKAKITFYQEQIILLVGCEQKDGSCSLHDVVKRLNTFLRSYDLECGASSMFDSLINCKYAYEQSGYALIYGMRRLKNQFLMTTSEKESRVFFFEDILKFCILNDSSSVVNQWRKSICGQFLLKLYDYDNEHEADNLQLLYTYLICERKAKMTGEILHMHRNSVVYRVEHLNKIAGDIDLDDSNVRLKLLMSYLMLSLYGLDD